MPKRKLRIVEQAVPILGICEFCNSQFKSTKPGLVEAEQEVAAAFNAHKCAVFDGARKAPRSARKAAKNK